MLFWWDHEASFELCIDSPLTDLTFDSFIGL